MWDCQGAEVGPLIVGVAEGKAYGLGGGVEDWPSRGFELELRDAGRECAAVNQASGLMALASLKALKGTPPTIALLDRLTHRCHILQTRNDSFRFKNSSAKADKPAKEKTRNLTNP